MARNTAFRWLAVATTALLLPIAAAAQQAQTSKWVNLRAGPARDYPLVMQLPPATPVEVQGCVGDFNWCDVITPDNVRGWVYAANLLYPYQNQAVPLLGYGATIGLPTITFDIGSYWGSHYRNRPWYGQEPQWARRPPPRRVVHPGPFPRPPAVRPPGPPHAPPGVRPPSPRPPGMRPPDQRPGPGVRPPDQRPGPGMRPPDRNAAPGARPPGQARPPEGRAPGGARAHPGGPGGPERQGGDRREQR